MKYAVRVFALIYALVFLGGFAAPVFAAADTTNHCWCLGTDKCFDHVWVDDDETKKVPFNCTSNKEVCNKFCTGKSQIAVHCDVGYLNQNQLDSTCIKAAGFTASENAGKAQVPIDLGVKMAGVSTVKDLGEYLALAYRYAVGVGAVIAVVMVVYGGFRFLLGSAVGTIESGKKIIRDALMGLLLILGAWLILNTINPATVKLKLPEIGNITGKGFKFAGAGVCKVDKDCETGSEKGVCILYDKEAGECTTGAEGALCVCRGDGCSRGSTSGKIDSGTCWSTNASLANAMTVGLYSIFCQALRNGQQMSKACDVEDVDRKCNNNGKGGMLCQAGLSCIMDDALGTFRCRKVKETSTKPTGDPVCTLDSGCTAPNSHCIMITADNGRCSDGSEGNLCKCSEGGGCQIMDNKNETNNSGTGKISGCNPGLECRLYGGGATVDLDGVPIKVGGWVCAKP